MKTELCDIMNKYGSDKGQGRHNYTVFYDKTFKSLKNKSLNVFELGLGTNNLDIKSNMGANGIPGASLRGWKEYFPSSLIYGADIDERILFEEDRIKTFYCDQTNKSIIEDMWNNEILKNVLFDIIIEDGLHEFNANLIFLKNSLHKLKNNGYFIIEDLLPKTIELFENEIDILKEQFSDYTFEIIKLEHNNNFIDNNLLVIKNKNTR
jgi:hypothetical protein